MYRIFILAVVSLTLSCVYGAMPSTQDSMATSQSISQTAWYIDPVNGIDKNDCVSPSTACATWAEYINRTGYEEDFDGKQVTVNVLNDLSTGDTLKKRARVSQAGSYYYIHGVRHVLLSSTLAAYSPADAPSNKRCQFSVTTGVLDNTMIGAIVSFPASSAYSVVTTVDVANQTATCLDPTDNQINSDHVTRPSVNVGDAVTIFAGTKAHIALDLQSSTDAATFTFPGGLLVDTLQESGGESSISVVANHLANVKIQYSQFCRIII
jgi:hypothetical protein